MRRMMFLVLMLNVFFLSGESLSELPIDKWPRDKEIDDKVKQIVKRMDWWAKKTEGLDALGWNIFFCRLGEKLMKIGIKGLPYMLESVRDEHLDWETRVTIVSNIPYMEGIDTLHRVVISALGEILLDKRINESVRAGICSYCLEKLKDTSATPYLIQVMEDKSNPERVRWCAAHAFVFIPDERAVKPLLKNLDEDPSMEVKKISISALGAIGRKTGNKAMVPKLMGIVEDKGRNPLRYFAISALGAMKEDRLVPLLTQSIKNKDKRDFDVVIWALGNIGTPECKEVLLQLLKDEDESIRFNAANALIKTGDKGAISEVERSLERFSSGYREVIGKALKEAKKE